MAQSFWYSFIFCYIMFRNTKYITKTSFSDIVREILENRAEIYQALDKSTPEEEVEEEGPSITEMMLMDHMKLRKQIVNSEIDENVQDLE